MVTLTPIIWTVRIGPDHLIYGDPYDGVATVQRCGDVAHVSAACGKLPIDAQIELSKELTIMGFTKVVFERIKDGKIYFLERELK